MAVPIDLTGQRALVTGAASGIGLACATLLAEAGASVILSDVDGPAAEKAAESLALAGGFGPGDAAGLLHPRASAEVGQRQDTFGRHFTRGGAANPLPANGSGADEQAADSGREIRGVQLDVSDWVACRELAERLGDEPVGILVNSAATWTLGPFLESDPQRWPRDLDVTLTGPMLLCRALLPAMVARGHGSVINIGSDAGRIGEPGQVAYSAAKGGIAAFTKALARETGRHGIRVNCVSPGLTRTPAASAYIDAMDPATIRRLYPLGRIGEAEDVANLVLFLASGRASWITGQVISVNGGYATPG
jgi:2-hydroxycyclohexanecarboxyl-CoA dehydrogenase